MDIYPGKTDKLLYEKQSIFQNIKVFEKLNDFRYLTLNDVHQGGHLPGMPGRLVLPYFKAACAALAFLDEPMDFLFIGMGMGAMPSFFRYANPKWRLDVVELDPEVFETARRFFNFYEDDNLHVSTGDGRAFITNTKKKYDAVFLDAYRDLSVPSHLTTIEFMREVRAILKPGGVSVSNLWGSVVNKMFESCVRTVQEEFGELYEFKSYTSNFIIVADAKPELMPHQILEGAKKAMRTAELGFSLPDLIRKQYKKIGPGDYESGRVLMDKDV